MRPFAPLLPLALCATVAHAQPDNNAAPKSTPADQQMARVGNPVVVLPPVKPRTGTQQEQIKVDIGQFVSNLNFNMAYMGSNALIYGANTAYWGANEWAKNWKDTGIQIQLDELSIANVEAKQATATIRYQANAEQRVLNDLLKARAKRGNVQGIVETLTLRKQQVGDREYWQIVPPEKLDPNSPETGIFAYVTYVLAQKGDVPTDALPYTFNTEGNHSLDNLKHLSLGVAQFTQDYDEVYLFRPRYMQEALTPYIQSTVLFRIPSSQRTYSFNGNLSGKNVWDVREPARTVLFYEGDDQQPIFHYDGKAAIAFADGHCSLVSPEEFKNAIWEVQTKKR